MPAKNLSRLAHLIADESHAATFQSLGQYRSALLKEIAQASAAPEQEPVAFRHKLSIHKDWKYTDNRAPDSFELRECQIENLYTHADPAEVERLRAENERLKQGFYQQVTDEDLKEIADFISDEKLPEKSFFMIPDAARLANVTMHMVREVQAVRLKLAEAQALLHEAHIQHWESPNIPLDKRIRAFLSATAQPAEVKSTDLYRFLDAAAGEGLICGAVDAGDLFISLYPNEYSRITAEDQNDE